MRMNATLGRSATARAASWRREVRFSRAGGGVGAGCTLKGVLDAATIRDAPAPGSLMEALPEETAGSFTMPTGMSAAAGTTMSTSTERDRSTKDLPHGGARYVPCRFFPVVVSHQPITHPK